MFLVSRQGWRTCGNIHWWSCSWWVSSLLELRVSVLSFFLKGIVHPKMEILKNITVALLSMQGQKALRFDQKYIIYIYEDEWRSYGFGTTWGWGINDRISILRWTKPLKSCFFVLIRCTWKNPALISWGQRKLSGQLLSVVSQTVFLCLNISATTQILFDSSSGIRCTQSCRNTSGVLGFSVTVETQATKFRQDLWSKLDVYLVRFLCKYQ